jgi:hypothetical protein
MDAGRPPAEDAGRAASIDAGRAAPRAAGASMESSAEPTAPRLPVDRGRDRRTRPTPRLSRYTFFGGRRRGPRRGREREGSFVDLYGTRLFALVLWVALMNVADSFFTLVHLQQGGVEANPVAEALLLTGRAPFVLLKSGLIALALLVLCVHKNFQLARIGLWIAAGAYTLLFLYHLFLFRR